MNFFFFLLCNISSLCAISYVPMVAIYVYQLNIWLLFERMWLNSMFIYLLEFSLLFALGALRLGENHWVQQVLGQHHPPQYAVSISTWNRATSSLARWATSDTSVQEPGGKCWFIWLYSRDQEPIPSSGWRLKLHIQWNFLVLFFLDLMWWCSGPFLMKEKGVLIIAECSTFCFSRFNEMPDQYLF